MIQWMAPEVMNFERLTSESDVWSFAVFAWEVYAKGAQPYDGSTFDR